ncbi:MAG: flagellar hook-length control protein FliK [Spirochaetaceae bacterium]|nr:flagellar hook-length control protein FliK [Spirochaetaceae bacterium]
MKREQASGRNELVKTLEAGSGFGTAASDKAAGVPAGAAGPAVSESAAEFRALLAERLQESWNGEIVKSAHIVLRDGDSGTIRLRLKPESLGNVKIELNLSDNNISGKIVVESDEAKTAFERNMAELADAFRAGGFDSARLEVSVGSGSGGGAARDEGGSGPFYSERLRSASASSAQPATAQAAYARLGGSVDIFA